MIDPPGGLVVLRIFPLDIRLDWRDVPGATEYRVYHSLDRFATWPWGTLGTVTVSMYTAVGHLADGLCHYYIVRAWDGIEESPNSTMGVKCPLDFAYSSTNSNIAWFSLPYASTYAKASDITNELTSAKVDVVGRWDSAKQWATVYYYAGGRWRGTDFSIPSGAGLYVSYRTSFSWVITGTDKTTPLTFLLYPPPNENHYWISLPCTSQYAKASDIVLDIEGSLTLPTKITDVGLWDSTAQALVLFYWDGSVWWGTDFAIPPGGGIRLWIRSTFSWTPNLLTPELP